MSIVFTTDVCRATSIEERTPVLLLFNVAQQLGLLLGPACNLFLRELDFHIGKIHVNKLNAPGFFLAVTYILFEILAYFAYYDLKVAKEEENNAESDISPILNQDILSNDEGKFDLMCLKIISITYYIPIQTIDRSHIFCVAHHSHSLPKKGVRSHFRSQFLKRVHSHSPLLKKS